MRMELMEKEVADLHRVNRNQSRRLDELQIQLTLLGQKLCGPAAENRGTEGRLPDLEVVRLIPPQESRPGDGAGERTAGAAADRAVDPRKVTERLPVDHRAAGEPLLGSGDGDDEESIAREFERGSLLSQASRHQEAAARLTGFVERHPDHFLTAEALYLIGESRMSQGMVAEARRTFAALARRYPGSERAVSALLLAGQCEEKLGEIHKARNTYLQLVETYPLSPEAAEASRRLQVTR